MEDYENLLDLSLLEELAPEEARSYLIGKYGLEFAQKTMILVEANIHNLKTDYAYPKEIHIGTCSRRA